MVWLRRHVCVDRPVGQSGRVTPGKPNGAVAGIHPAFGLGGTLIGAIFWGTVGDRIGRLRTLLVTIGIFSATSLINGFAVSFPMVVAVCFVMGFGVGGAVPLAFTMLAEYLPVRYRSRTVVIVGILAITGGYAIASIGAITLLPAFGWRSLFLIGVLPAALIVWMARAIPESPRFLCGKGRYAEAEGIVRRRPTYRKNSIGATLGA